MDDLFLLCLGLAVFCGSLLIGLILFEAWERANWRQK